MSDPVRLTEMLDLARGEVASMEDIITLHRKKGTRPENWFVASERTLQHRRQVVRLVLDEIERRYEEKKDAA